jgi:hypothetical protein
VYCEIDGLRVDVDLAELSTAGLFVNSATEATADAEVEVFLRIKDTTWTSGGHIVQVVSCERAAEEGRRPGFALLFTNVDDAQRQRLREAISHVRKQRVASTPPSAAHSAPPNQAATTARSLRPERSSARARSLSPQQQPSHRPLAQNQPAATRNAASDQPPGPTRAGPSARAARVITTAKAVSAPTLSAEASSVLPKLRADLRLLDHKPPWGVLGIAQGSSMDQAKAAFFDASKRYHPHLYSRHGSAEITRLVTELFIAHKRAYDMILKASAAQPTTPAERGSTPPERVSVTTAIEVPASEPPPSIPNAAAEPPQPTAERPQSAASHSMPPERKPRTADVERLVKGALKHVAASRVAQAEVELQMALELDPQCLSARVWQLVLQARRQKAAGDARRAHAKYLEVLTLDAKHHEALTETKKHSEDLRDKQPGLLGKLFGSGNK